MSFLSELVGAVAAGFEGDSSTGGGLAKEMLQRFQQQQGGGLGGLIAQLGSKGLSEIVQSWVGTGPNKDVSPDQLSRALDPDLLKQLAAKFGISPQAVSAHLADILPKLVDRLTPDGKIPAELQGTEEEPAVAGAAS
jgi:uncharacterized protein YidB (DUF937 family)